MTATEQEQRRLVDERFHRCYERPVLEAILKHSTDNLERLVEQCSAKLRGELFPGEPVLLHKGSVATKIKGTVVKLDSPLQSRGFVPDKTSASTTVPADHKYTVTLEQQEEMLEVVGIPGADLVRQNKLPSKDAIKAFIKAHAACNEVTREWRLMPGKAAEYGLKVGGHHADVNQLLQRQKQQPQIHLQSADAKPTVSLVKSAALAPSAASALVICEPVATTATGSFNGTRESDLQKPSERQPKDGSSTISSASSGKPAAPIAKKKKLLSNGGSQSEGVGLKRRNSAAEGKKSNIKKAKVTMDAFCIPKIKATTDVSRVLEAGEFPAAAGSSSVPTPVPQPTAASAEGRLEVYGNASAGVCDAEKKPADPSDVSRSPTKQTTDDAGSPGRDTAQSARSAAASDAMSWDSDDSMVLSAVKKQISPSKRDALGEANDLNGSEVRGPQGPHKSSPRRPDKPKETGHRPDKPKETGHRPDKPKEKKKKKPKSSDGKSRIKTESGRRQKADSSSDDEVALIAYKNGSSGTSSMKAAAGEPGSKKVGLKQATLFDLSRKSLGGGSSANAAATTAAAPQQPVTPEVVHKYQKAEAEMDFVRMQQLLQQAATELSAQQREALPESMRAAVREKHDYIELKKKMKFASAEDKAAMQKQLRSYRLKQAADKRRMMQTRCEDTSLELKPLPAARPVGSAEDAVVFSEAVRVSEFIRCYHGLLAPGNTEDGSKVSAESLVQLLTGASAGDSQAVAMLGKIVAMLLQTLVNDERLEGVKVFGVPIRDIPVNAFTASEMARLVLTDGDRSAADVGSSDEPESDAKRRSDCGDPDGITGISKDIADDLLSRLCVCEFSALTPEQNLAVLTALCDLVLCSRSAENYVTDKQQEAVESCKQRIAEAKMLTLKKSELEKQGNPTDGHTTKRPSKEGAKSLESSSEASVAAALAAAADGASSEPAAAPDSDASDRGAGLAAVLRQRREQAAKSAREREQKQQQERVQREREAEVRRLVKQLETLEKLCTERATVAKEVLRCAPLGYDRNHSRYWFFASARPGIYVEQGWVGEEMTYCVQADPATAAHATYESSERGIEGTVVAPLDEPTAAAEREATKKTSAAAAAAGQPRSLLSRLPHSTHSADADLEKTHPMPDRNQWFVYDNQKDIDALLAALHPRGVRETALADNIKQLYPELTRLIKATAGTGVSTADATVPAAATGAAAAADAVSEHVAQVTQVTRADELANAVSKFREELEYQESRLRSGSLGGVSDVEAWLHSVHTATDISALAARLIECGEAVFPKFIKGPTEPTPHGSEPSTAVAPQTNSCADTKMAQGCVTEKQPPTDDPLQDAATANTFCLSRWKEAVRGAATVSRLHVLLGILEACIRWDKSAENAKCKVCRRKGDEASLLLCDECNMAFHTQCLRPALNKVPDGDWFCPACKPIFPKRDAHIERQAQRPVSSLDSHDGSLHSDDDYDDRDRESDGSEASGDSSDDSKDDREDVGVCCVCSDDSGCLVVCTVCLAAYHLRCHSPPLRCPPVGTNWACIGCRASREITSKKRSKQPHKNPATGDRSRHGRRERSPDASDNDSEYKTEEQDSDVSHGDARGSSGNKKARSESRSANRMPSAKALSKKGSRVADQGRLGATGSSHSRRMADSMATGGSTKRPAAARQTRLHTTLSKTSDGLRQLGTVISTTLVDEGGSISDEDSSSYARRERRPAVTTRAHQLPLMWGRGKRQESEDMEKDEEEVSEEREDMSQTDGQESTGGEEGAEDEIKEASDEEYRGKELGNTTKAKRKFEPSRSESRVEGASRGPKVPDGVKNGSAAASVRARKASSRESNTVDRDDDSSRRGKTLESATGGRRSARRALPDSSSEDSDASLSTKKQLRSQAADDSDTDLSNRNNNRRQAAARQSKQAAVVAIRNGYDSLSSESESDSTALDRNDTSGRKRAKQGQTKGQRSTAGNKDDDCCDTPRLDHWRSESSNPSDAKRKKNSDDVQSSKRRVTSRDSVDSSLFKALDALLQKLLKHPSSADFEEAVDPSEVPDYYDVVEKPITLISISDKISKCQYDSVDDFLSDMTLLFRNAFEYNKVDSEVGREAKRLEDEFIRLLGTSLPACRYQSQYKLFAASAAAAPGKASKQRR